MMALLKLPDRHDLGQLFTGQGLGADAHDGGGPAVRRPGLDPLGAGGQGPE